MLQPGGSGGRLQLEPTQAFGTVIRFAMNRVLSVIVGVAAKVTTTEAIPSVVPALAGTVAKITLHSVPAAAPEAQSVVAVVVPSLTETNVVFAGTTSYSV